MVTLLHTYIDEAIYSLSTQCGLRIKRFLSNFRKVLRRYFLFVSYLILMQMKITYDKAYRFACSRKDGYILVLSIHFVMNRNSSSRLVVSVSCTASMGGRWLCYKLSYNQTNLPLIWRCDIKSEHFHRWLI